MKLELQTTSRSTAETPSSRSFECFSLRNGLVCALLALLGLSTAALFIAVPLTVECALDTQLYYNAADVQKVITTGNMTRMSYVIHLVDGYGSTDKTGGKIFLDVSEFDHPRAVFSEGVIMHPDHSLVKIYSDKDSKNSEGTHTENHMLIKTTYKDYVAEGSGALECARHYRVYGDNSHPLKARRIRLASDPA